MKIYIVEEDNYDCWVKPQVFINPDKAIAEVRMRYEEVRREYDLEDGVDGPKTCMWLIDEEAGTGNARVSIYQDYWEWRITEHEV